MPESSKIQKLDIIATIREGITIGMSNIVAIFVNVLLWILTIWIPYLNVGTTIGLWLGIVSKASKDEKIPMTEIFNPRYRKYMGEFFITSGLMGIGIAAGIVFLIVPAIIMGIAWGLAPLLVIDRGKNPTEAITMSNDYTYGNKGRIFLIYFLIFLVVGILAFLLFKVPKIGIYLAGVINILVMFVMVGLQASVYKQLTGGKIRTSKPAAPASAAKSDKFCPACGKKNTSGTKFCADCGAKM